MNTNIEFLLVAVTMAIAFACFMGIFLCCLYCLCQNSKKRRKAVDIEMSLVPGQGLGEMVVMLDDDQEVAKRAFKDSGNVLWTNEGKVEIL